MENVLNTHYHLPTKLRECNVFSHVCQSFWPWGSHVTITHDALDLTIQRPLYIQGTPSPGPIPLYRDQLWPKPPGPAAPCYWHLVATMGDMFKHVHLMTPVVVTSGGQDQRHVQVCSLEDPIVVTFGDNDQRHVQTFSLKDPPVVTFGGRYSWQAGGMHPTGML